MFRLEQLRRKINEIVRRAWPFGGADRNWQSWHVVRWPEIVRDGPPADLSEKECRDANREFLADV